MGVEPGHGEAARRGLALKLGHAVLPNGLESQRRAQEARVHAGGMLCALALSASGRYTQTICFRFLFGHVRRLLELLHLCLCVRASVCVHAEAKRDDRDAGDSGPC